MTCKYKVKIKDIQFNYKVQMTDIQSKYKFKVFCTGYDDSEIKEKIDAMYQAWPKVSGEGETITLNDTVNTTMAIDLKGNTSQDTTTGKNLLETKIETATKDGITLTHNEDGTYTLNGTATAGTFFQCSQYSKTLPSGTYTFGSSATLPTGLFYSLIQGSGTYVFYTRNGTDTATTTLEEETTYNLLKEYMWIANGTTFNNFKLKPQLEKSAVATDYEKYTGGIASPNPDYPQDIHTINGDNTIKVYGKNLFDKDNANIIDNKYLNASGVEVNDNAFAISDYIQIQSNQTYSLTPRINVGACLCYYDTNKNFISSVSLSNINNTFVTPANSCYIKTSFKKDVANSIQIELGSQATTYEPYQSNSVLFTLGDKEICKIGNYEDKIFKAIKGNEIYDSLSSEEKNTLNYGKWYLRKAIKKIIANGTETFNLSTDYINAGRFNIQNYTDCIYGNLNQPGSISSHFKSVFATANGNIYNSGIAREICMINTDFAGNLNGFKSWLETNQPIIYYILATPTNELFNDAIQEQLEDIYNNMLSYEGQTNISQINNDLPFNINSSALKDLSDL